jgi:hypothetical protein
MPTGDAKPLASVVKPIAMCRGSIEAVDVFFWVGAGLGDGFGVGLGDFESDGFGVGDFDFDGDGMADSEGMLGDEVGVAAGLFDVHAANAVIAMTTGIRRRRTVG